MEQVETLHTFKQLKILADERRLEILRRLMTEPATLTQLGLLLKKSSANVRHHLKILEKAGLVEMSDTRVTSHFKEKYYRAKAPALVLQELILPFGQKPVIIFSGSHDFAIEHIARVLAPSLSMLILPTGSLDGLINLRQGLCHITGTHLLDSNSQYNIPIVRRLFQDRLVSMVTLAHRTQGLIVAPQNPKGLKQPIDLVREDVTLINRNPGSGTRIWLDNELKRLNIPISSICGYKDFVMTHSAAARAVKIGQADVAIGIQAAAREAQVDFIPLFEERYDLVFPVENARLVSPILDYLQTSAFRRELDNLTGYNTAHSGEQIHLDDLSSPEAREELAAQATATT